MNIIAPQTLKQDYTPQHIINRAYEQDVLHETVAAHRPASLYVHGPRGTGKTLVARTVLDRVDDTVDAVPVPCTVYDNPVQGAETALRSPQP